MSTGIELETTETTNKQYEEIMESIFESMKNTPEYREFQGVFGLWLGHIQYELMPDESLKLFTDKEKQQIIDTYEEQRGLTYDQLIELFPNSRLSKRRREEQQEELKKFYKLYKKEEALGDNEEYLDVYKTDLKRILTANPNIDTSFILDRNFTPFAKAIGLEKDVIDMIRSNRFKKKRPLVSAFFGYGKGGKTKRRKNKKTKRRKNKKTKRRK